MRSLRVVAAAAALAALPLSVPAWAGVQYYLTDHLSAIDSLKWTAAGTLAPASAGVAAADSSGGSLISRIPIPDGSSEAEVRLVLKLTHSGGTYTAFLQATPDARTGGTGSGAYLALEMQNPEFDTDGNCLANFVLLQRVGGAITLLSTFPHACRDGMELRLAVHGNQALVWPDVPNPIEYTVAPIGAGQPGIGAYGTPAGNAISQVQLGAIDRTAPTAVDAQGLGVSVFRKHVDLRWKAVAASATASPLAGYWIYRDGLYLGRTTDTQFSDETVASGDQHTYTVLAVNQHGNFSAAATAAVAVPVPVLTPAPPLPFGLGVAGTAAAAPQLREKMGAEPRAPVAGTPQADSGGGLDPRRVGVRALGSYWGGAGEQIDTLSGNLNLAIPLLTAKARGSWSVTFMLSYNSQMWRKDGAGTWLLGRMWAMGWVGSCKPGRWCRSGRTPGRWIITCTPTPPARSTA